ncbi:MAG TPA: hydrogenase formation protein HypD [Firmicutes bacterium]|nr:hydrogenase formation protein HypD [Bacillota bacterium]
MDHRNQALINLLVDRLRSYSGPAVRFMEVCGTHTMSIFRYGLRAMLPPTIQLISGPGCPVCVTPSGFIDQAIRAGMERNTIIATFGDLMRVPGSRCTLERARAAGADIRIVYSPLDALPMAQANPGRLVVFLAVGFETTAPGVAMMIQAAEAQGIRNVSILPGLKRMPPVLKALVSTGEHKLDGLLCPGHVAAIIGENSFRFLASEHGLPAVIAGFEPLDLVMAIYKLVNQISRISKVGKAGKAGMASKVGKVNKVDKEKWGDERLRVEDSGAPRLENAYTRAVKPEGNTVAWASVRSVFEWSNSVWRGFGQIPESGMALRAQYGHRDARTLLGLDPDETMADSLAAGCQCGLVLRGRLAPPECPIFARRCSPQTPLGACMVSPEGACSAYYRYSRGATAV